MPAVTSCMDYCYEYGPRQPFGNQVAVLSTEVQCIWCFLRVGRRLKLQCSALSYVQDTDDDIGISVLHTRYLYLGNLDLRTS